MNQGWIKLHRELFDKPIWLLSTPEQKVVLIALLGLANHAEKKWEWQGKPYTCKAGQFITSLESIKKRCGKGISLQNIRSSLKRFENFGFLTNKSTKQNRLITICNWDTYQKQGDEANNQINNQTANDQQTANSQLTTNNNDKNVKKEKKGGTPKSFYEMDCERAAASLAEAGRKFLNG
jgi:DNA replication protein DnaD